MDGNSKPALSMDEVRASLAATVATLDSEIAKLDGELRAKREERKRYQSVLYGIDPSAKPPTRIGRPPSGDKRRHARVSQAVQEQIFAYLREHPNSTSREVAEAIGISRASAQYGVSDLRNKERLRVTGKRSLGQHGTPAATYSVMDDGDGG